MSQRCVVDADGHVLEPEDMWRRFLEPQWRDRAIRIAVDDEGMENLLIDGRPHMLVRGIMGMIGGVGMQDDIEALWTPGMRTYQDGLVPGGYDPAARIAMKRVGTVEDCAKVVEFLTTDLSDYVTGAVIPIDGGLIR